MILFQPFRVVSSRVYSPEFFVSGCIFTILGYIFHIGTSERFLFRARLVFIKIVTESKTCPMQLSDGGGSFGNSGGIGQ
jgi:hypothetical protein